jgi:hypothetical protein
MLSDPEPAEEEAKQKSKDSRAVEGRVSNKLFVAIERFDCGTEKRCPSAQREKVTALPSRTGVPPLLAARTVSGTARSLCGVVEGHNSGDVVRKCILSRLTFVYKVRKEMMHDEA